MLRALVPTLLLIGCQEYDLAPSHDPLGTQTENADPNGNGQVPPGVPTGGISGRICAPNGATWVAGARVAVSHDYGRTKTFTDGDGWFLLEGLPVGTHTVEVTKGSFSTSFVVQVQEDRVTELAYTECLEQGDTKIAVVTGEYDHIGTLIDHLGITYDEIEGVHHSEYRDFLSDEDWMSEYDAIFFNCGMGFDWVDDAQSTQNLRTYVRDGGSVYASDWAYFLVEATWPAKQAFYGDDSVLGQAFVGDAGTFQGNVLDPTMADLLGSNTAVLNYDLDAWAALEATDAQVLIEGEYTYSAGLFGGGTLRAPLAARFEDGDGSVVFTTFHNEQQTTIDMGVILQEIILSL